MSSSDEELGEVLRPLDENTLDAWDRIIRRSREEVSEVPEEPPTVSPAREIWELDRARIAWARSNPQLPLITCHVCQDAGCEFCPRV